MIESANYPYPYRPGTNNEALVLDIDAARPLRDEDLTAVLTFEHQLYAAELDPNLFPSAEAYRLRRQAEGQPLKSLETLWQKKLNSTNLGVSYFMNPSGRENFYAATGVALESETLKDCAVELSKLDITNLSPDSLDKLEADSVGYEESRLTRAFIDNGYAGDGLPSPQLITVYKNPVVLVDKARGYRDLKTYLGRVVSDINRSESDVTPLSKAQLLVSELYRRRLNVFLVDNYVSAYKLLSQYRLSNRRIHTDIVSELATTLPAFSVDFDDTRIANFLQRLDRLRYGVSRDEHGSFTWLSPEAQSIAERALTGDAAAREIQRGPYSNISPTVLESTTIDSQIFGSWISDVLAKYDLLSAQHEWDSEREGPASDGKWQVIVNDKFKSLVVNDKQRVVKVPTKPRYIAEAIELINHEVTHVWQNENKRALGSLAILERIGIDSADEQTEAGGLWQEVIASEALRGKANNDIRGTSYLKAIQVKARGGTFGECVQAYFDDLATRLPQLSIEKVAAQAINRSRRVFRSGGFEFAQANSFLTNTQPLNYLEQRLIYEGLDEQQKELLFIGGVSINNLVRLSAVGLVDTQKIHIPKMKPWELLYERVVEHLAKTK